MTCDNCRAARVNPIQPVRDNLSKFFFCSFDCALEFRGACKDWRHLELLSPMFHEDVQKLLDALATLLPVPQGRKNNYEVLLRWLNNAERLGLLSDKERSNVIQEIGRLS